MRGGETIKLKSSGWTNTAREKALAAFFALLEKTSWISKRRRRKREIKHRIWRREGTEGRIGRTIRSLGVSFIDRSCQ